MRKPKEPPSAHIEHSNIYGGNQGEHAALELAKALKEMGRAAAVLAANLKETGGNIGILVGDYHRGDDK